MTAKLTESLEDYLEAIAELIAIDGHAHSKAVAEKLNVTMPSVTGALRQLVQQDLIIYNTHHPVQLTAKGKAVAERIMRHHEVLKMFFSGILGLPLDKATETACRLEHIVDEDTIERFVLFSEAIAKRSDARALKTYLTEAMSSLCLDDRRRCCVLCELPQGEPAVVLRLGRNIPAPEKLPLSPGDSLTLQNVSLDGMFFTVCIGERTHTIPLAEAENIWLERT
ncbi:MAG: metal-dependent transcriptional regulator [Oligosphaeraceae bacterium]|nr:metal-dependent transcriptional regulator [Oligosphaeraceae bacterium]